MAAYSTLPEEGPEKEPLRGRQLSLFTQNQVASPPEKGGGNEQKAIESRPATRISCGGLNSHLNFISNPNQTPGIISKCFFPSHSLSAASAPDCSTYLSLSLSTEMSHCHANSRMFFFFAKTNECNYVRRPSAGLSKLISGQFSQCKAAPVLN